MALRATPTEPQSGVWGQTLTARNTILRSNGPAERPWEHPRGQSNPRLTSDFCGSPPGRDSYIHPHTTPSTPRQWLTRIQNLQQHPHPNSQFPLQKKNQQPTNDTTPKPAKRTIIEIDPTPKSANVVQLCWGGGVLVDGVGEVGWSKDGGLPGHFWN
ncbi:hypothetical protein PGTUg99_018370 [Puccinia graminis f. sp. tritici]|uniref:Uncharacterized protein n=1 Tax=Puccinia graminis f. sp. tritici TaxID=56615 RepID=A0A5B0MQA9_PUCGR|nr:hypothetical protein PGTUg99_018370 [Puccinia graminis f. sp. tritici]